MILGRRGCGKSTLGRQIMSAYPRKIIFDTLGEYTSADGSETWDYGHFAESVKLLRETKEYALIYHFDPEKEGLAQEEFNQAMKLVWYSGNAFVVVEEVQNFTSAYTMPHWMSQAVTTGRHRHLGLLFTTQMPRFCHKALISQANHVFCGQLHEKNDLDYVRSVFGADAERLPSLPQHSFLYFRLGDSKIREVRNVPPSL